MSTLSLAVDENNDIYLDANGNIALVYDLEAVRQDCDHAAKTLLGDLIFNQDLGIPYLQTVFTPPINLTQFEAALRDNLLGVNSAITQVLSVSINQNGDVLNYVAQIASIYGEFEISGAIPDAL